MKTKTQTNIHEALKTLHTLQDQGRQFRSYIDFERGKECNPDIVHCYEDVLIHLDASLTRIFRMEESLLKVMLLINKVEREKDNDTNK